MEYGKIVSVTGLPGLFELVSSKNDGAIVRSLEDKTTKFVSSRIHNFSHLESIEIYTVRDNVNLVDVFNAIAASGDKLPDGKDASVLKKYFEKVFPDLDFERVYSSDMKKIIKWYTILKAANVEIKLREFEEEVEAEETPAEEAALAEKPAKKAKKEEAVAEEQPKAAAKKKAATEEEGEAKEEKPKKKAAPKAKKEEADGEEKPKAPAKKKAAPAADKAEKAEKKTKK